MRKLLLAAALSGLLSSAGCVGLVLDLLSPAHDNLVAGAEFMEDPAFGSKPPAAEGPRTHTAADVARTPGVVWLELVVGPESNLAGNASGIMVEFAGRPHVLSAGHIARGPKYLAIYAYLSEGGSAPEEVEIVVADETLDFSLLRFKNPGLSYGAYPRLGSSRDLRKGDKVFAFGSPFGYEFMVREGVVSKLDFGLHYHGFRQPQLILHDATLNPGDSGGPLFNDRGEIVGINALGVNPGTSRFVSTIYGAIPIDDVKTVLRGLKKGGYVEHPRIGWKVYDTAGLNPLNFRDKKMPRPKVDGLMVYHVEPGSAADKAGLRVGDILLSIDGREPRSPNDVARYLLFERRRGDQVDIRVYRETHWTKPDIRPDERGYLTVYYESGMDAQELTLRARLE